MQKPRRLVAAALALAVLVAIIPASQSKAQSTPPTPAIWDFNEYTATSPMPLGSHAMPSNGARTPNLGVHVYSRDSGAWQALEPISEVHHGTACQAPPASHASADPMPYHDAVFVCGGDPHLMTAINASGYGLIYLTPAAMLDFSNGSQTVSWDISTWWASGRDWWDVWLTPYDDNLVAPLDNWLPDLQGEPERGIHVRLSGNGRLGAEVMYPNGSGGVNVMALPNTGWNEYTSVLTPSQSIRSTFRITMSRTHLKVDLLNTAGAPIMTWVDADFPTPLDWSQGVVQFGHHSYTPMKDCNTANAPAPDGTCKPNTWHWDNLKFSAAVPFTQIGANERLQVAAAPGAAMTFTFPRSSPANAHLRVSASGAGYQYSIDNGATWAPMNRQTSAKDHQGGFETFWTPFPAGATSVQIRATQRGWWPYEAVNNVEVWSQQASSSPTPAVPTPTLTAMPTASPTGTPTTTPTVPPTSTAPPTMTPTATVAATQAVTATQAAATITPTSLPATRTPTSAATVTPATTCTPIPVGNSHHIRCKD